jgi:hypothetical protein
MLKHRHRAWIRSAAPLVGLWAVVAAYYVFVISAGHFTKWYTWSALYNAQAEGLRQGHLYLPEAPSHALMALKNPYDIVNMRFWRWDHSYYQGHLYLYWGLVPAFIAAAIKALFRVVAVADNALTFAFCIIRLIAGTLLIRDVARNAARRPPGWAVGLAMVVFAVANPTPYTLARAGVYEAAIMGGVAFVIAGLYLGHRSLAARTPRAAIAWLGAASLSFGLAGGSRLNLMPTIVALALLTGLWRWRQFLRDGENRLFGSATAALAPAGAVTIALLVINQLRFGHWAEFGRSYVMTYPYFLPGGRFILPNAYTYALSPPDLACSFPYLTVLWHAVRQSTPGWLPLIWPSDHYSPEATAGLLIVAPFTWFALIGVVAAVGRARLRRVGGAALTLRRWETRGNWVWVALGIYVVGAGPLFILNVTTMRYEQDFASGLLLIAIFGAWRLLAAPATRRGRRAMAWLYGLLAVSTIVAGVLLGFSGYFKHFEHHNPTLWRALRATLSVCGGK